MSESGPVVIEPGALIDCDVTALAFGGRGVARLEGMVVFVERGLPGQRVRARVERTKKRFAEARVEEVLSPSPHQVEPFCRHFGVCGGCLFQDLDYAEQLRWKERHVADALARIGGLEAVDLRPILASPAQRGYRNKMEFAFEGRGDGLRLGLRERGGQRVVDLLECHLQPPETARLLAAARVSCRASGLPAWDGRAGFWRHLVVRRSEATGELLVHCLTGPESRHFQAVLDLAAALKEAVPGLTAFVHSVSAARSGPAAGQETIRAVGADHLTERLGDLSFRVSAEAFFQTNTRGAELLYGAVADMAGLTGAEVVFDLYCGSGGIALTLARRAARVFGFEVVEPAVEDARFNAGLNGLSNCRFVAGRIAPRRLKDLPAPDVLVCDPPRAGLDDPALEAVRESGAARVVAVSCDPATLARDVARLAPVYELVAVQPADLFPHTAHVEAVALLRRRG